MPALFCDLYELTMAEAYFRHGHRGEAVFSLFVRSLPETRNVLIAAGLETVLDQMAELAFTDADIAYLRSLDRFSDKFLDHLARWRFRGEVRAMAEGTPVFPGEPLLEVRAPILDAQILETLLINQIGLQTLLASKARRVVAAAEGRTVVDFAARRMQGHDAALKGARAFHIAGVSATSNLEAGARYGMPVAGTMAHSFVQSYDDERSAFQAFAEVFPGTTLLVDTYDPIRGVHRAIDLVRHGRIEIGAVRLDSGDLASLARETRAILDAAGLTAVKIFASGGLDEHRIAALLDAGAPIDGFGVGTAMGVSADAPTLDMVYKLVSYEGEGRLKTSPDKTSLPGAKQVFRYDRDGRMAGDVIATAEETGAEDSTALLALVMSGGRRTRPAPTLDALQAACSAQWQMLPDAIQGLTRAAPFPVRLSQSLEARRDAAIDKQRGGEG